MQIDIILRTYDHKSVHPRRFDKPKRDIVWRCVRSLMTAIKNVPKITPGVRGYSINLTIIDDHSSNLTKNFLYNETKFMGNRCTITEPDGTGNNASLLAALVMGRYSKADLVYIVEDDYLHQPDALTTALKTWHIFWPKNGFPLLAMSLTDCASNYEADVRDRGVVPTNHQGDGSEARIVGGSDRPWRSIGHTGVCFLLERGVLQNHWEPFEQIARYWPYFEERLTFNKLWNTKVGMYCPLVPLSYHLWEDHPYYPVKDLWEANKCLELAA